MTIRTYMSGVGQQIEIVLIVNIIPVCLFLVLGYLIEEIFTNVRSAPAHNRGFNYACIALFVLSECTIGGFISIRLSRLVSLIPGAGFIHLPGNDHGHLLAALALSLFSLAIYDLFQYWQHRLEHTKWLWPEHELHHSDECMNASTTFRHHWLEPVIQAVLIGVPAGIIFTMPTVSVGIAYILVRGINYFIHLNAGIELGWFSRVIANPQTHRIHHSRLPQHLDKNFAVVLPLWDILFGTYYHPAKGEWPATGLCDGRTVNSIPQALVIPFLTWWSLIRKPEKTSRAASATSLS